MKMNKNFSYYLSKFLKDYLIIERNMSDKTLKSYKDGMKLFITYLVEEKKMQLTSITFENITREIVLEYLNYLEETKRNSINTRNQRLAILKSFYKYCSLEEIENMENIKKVLTIKIKKAPEKIMDYLTEEELKKLLESIDTSSKNGRRNLLVVTLLYDTAARASEIINLKIEDIHLEQKYIILTGKGKKQRVVPIMDKTRDMIVNYLNENDIKNGYLFSIKKHKMNENFIKDIIKKITIELPLNKNITPHTLRRTRAIHLLSAGVNTMYIRDLLGHESVITTEKYARVIEKNKFEAIEKATPNKDIPELDDWNDNQDLLSQLLSL